MVHCEVEYSGRVQGVGFRYTAKQIADRHTVHGWVRNEQNGTVRLVVEGEEDEIERFLCEVRSRMKHTITTENVERSETLEGLKGFAILIGNR